MKNAVGFYFFVLYLFLFVCFFNKKHYIIVNTLHVVDALSTSKTVCMLSFNFETGEILVSSETYMLT